jgi:hypothetical protein
MQLYITAKPISYCNYPISKMSCAIMSLIFGKALYLIPRKTPPKRFARIRGYYASITLIDYQIVRSPYPYIPQKEKGG